MRSAQGSWRPTCWRNRCGASSTRPAAPSSRRVRASPRPIRKAASSSRRRSRRRCCGCAARRRARSPARRSRCREARRGERNALRLEGEAAAVDPAAARLAHHRGRTARAAGQGIRHHAAAIRRLGCPLSHAGRHADERPVALSAGLERQRHRHRRPAGVGRAVAARPTQRRSSHLDRTAHTNRQGYFSRHGGGTRTVGRRTAGRRDQQRRATIDVDAQGLSQQLGGTGMTKIANFRPEHFLWQVEGKVARVRLDRPERKNPLTFQSYAELRDTFRELRYAEDVDAVVFLPNGGNFCSGGDVHDIIGPLVAMEMKELLAFTRMTGDLVKAMLACGKPIITAVDGVAVGAGAIIVMASDIRIATPEAKTAFLFTRVGLAGCDMGACAILPRIIGQGRAAELLYTGRTMSAAEGERWGFYNRLVAADALEKEAIALAQSLASGPTFAHAMTKTQLVQEWSMSLEQAIEAEAQAQAICMQTRDFERAYRAFVAKEKPVFEGN